MTTAKDIPPLKFTEIVGSEGFRLFFPLSALFLVVWPVLWVFVHGFGLPFSQSIPPSFWHAHEMIVGGFGAALIGFITTAIPEWTDTAPLRGKPLFGLAGIWAVACIIGLLGADTISFIGALADLIWMAALIAYIVSVGLNKRTTRLVGFTGWLIAQFLAEGLARVSFMRDDYGFAQMAAHLPGYVFLGFLGLALARISVPVTNLILDPHETTTPYRPHPGRMNLSSGLIAIVILGELAGLANAVTAYLMIAAGAAFLDRVGEAFIGREALRAEILALAGSSALAGLGLLLIGASRLDAEIFGVALREATGLHIALMGGLGMGIMAVFSIAGLLHCGQKFQFRMKTKLAFIFLALSVFARVAPDIGLYDLPVGPAYGLSALLWTLAFVLWSLDYVPLFIDRETMEKPQAC